MKANERMLADCVVYIIFSKNHSTVTYFWLALISIVNVFPIKSTSKIILANHLWHFPPLAVSSLRRIY